MNFIYKSKFLSHPDFHGQIIYLIFHDNVPPIWGYLISASFPFTASDWGYNSLEQAAIAAIDVIDYYLHFSLSFPSDFLIVSSSDHSFILDNYFSHVKGG